MGRNEGIKIRCFEIVQISIGDYSRNNGRGTKEDININNVFILFEVFKDDDGVKNHDIINFEPSNHDIINEKYCQRWII